MSYLKFDKNLMINHLFEYANYSAMKLFYFFIIPSLLLLACNDEIPAIGNINQPKESLTDYSIPIDSALANLERFMLVFDNEPSRAGKTRKVSTIHAVKYPRFISRAGINNCDNILYVANFGENQGYALLAGDTRIEEPVIALTDSGSITPSAITRALVIANSRQRPVYLDFPLDGDGFFTRTEYDNQLFMNPNTVDLYNPERDETLVGNFKVDGTSQVVYPDEEDSNENGFTTSIDNDLGIILGAGYALNEINEKENGDNESGGNHGWARPGDSFNLDGDGNVHLPKNYTYETTYTPWETVKVEPILKKYSWWSQEKGFNLFYPLRWAWVCPWGNHAPAGCFPLALAKIMTLFEHPKMVMGKVIDYPSIQNKENFDYDCVGYLLFSVSQQCHSMYFSEGTFTWPGDVTKYMKGSGYRNADSWNYTFSRVTDMLDNGKPVIIYSIPGIRIDKSHAWNIDGYKYNQRIMTTKEYDSGELVRTTVMPDVSPRMVHCDFGWESKNNGYYVSGIFKVNDERAEIDSLYTSNKTNFNNYVKVILYDKPN